MSDMCAACGRSGPRDFDEVAVKRLVERGRHGAVPREELWEAIRVMLVDGVRSRHAIAKHLRVSDKTVAQVARAFGFASSQPSAHDVSALATEMVRRYEDGQTIAQIAVAVSRAESTVRKHLERAGCQFRGSGWKAAGS